MDELFHADYGLVKYVNIACNAIPNVYRFCSNYADHKNLVNPGEKVISAGFLAYDTDSQGRYFKILSDWSSTLHKGPNIELDAPSIAKILGYRYKEES